DFRAGRDLENWTQEALSRGLWMIRNPRKNPKADVNQPNLLAWTHPDEPDVNGLSPAKLQSQYKKWKAADPQRAVIANFAGATAATPDEVRGETWAAIIHGAKGMIYFPQSFGPDVTDGTPADVAAEMTLTNHLITKYGGALNSNGNASANFMSLTGGLEGTW